jgi:hypothetical protein
MSGRISTSKLCIASAIVFLVCPWVRSTAQNVRFDAVSRDVIESRLRKYAGNNKQREASLKEIFAAAGCDDVHLSEQPVKLERRDARVERI